MQQATLVFLIKRSKKGKIAEILLAMKKRGFGKGRFNGVGGKPKKDETLPRCAVRETKEEIGVKAGKLKKIGLIKFRFKFTPEFNQNVYFYTCEKWQNEPTESEEVKPRWFNPRKIPYKKMWPDDEFWMPLMLEGKKFGGKVVFGENDEILKNEIAALRSQ